MTPASMIQFAAAIAGAMALVPMWIHRHENHPWRPSRSMLMLLITISITHFLSGLELSGFRNLDRLVDYLRLVLPILWGILIYGYVQIGANRRVVESEARFRAFMEHSPTVTFIKDGQGRYVFGNSAWAKQFRRPPEELLGKTDIDLWGPEISRTFQESDARARDAGALLREEESVQGPDGRTLTFDVLKFPVPTPTGPDLLGGLAIDISDRKRQEIMVEQIARGVSADTGDTFFRSLVQHLSSALGVEYAFVGELEPGNEAIVRTLAVCGGDQLIENFTYEVANTPCALTLERQIYSVSDRCAAIYPKDVLLAQMQVQSYCGVTLRGPDQKPIGLVAVMSKGPLSSVTFVESILRIFAVRAAAELNRLVIENELRDSRRRLRLAMRASHMGVWDLHVPSGKALFDEAWCRMIGHEPAEIEPHVRSWEERIHPDDKLQVMEAWTAHLEGRAPYYETEHRLLTKSGQWKWILDQGLVVERDSQGKAVRAIGTDLNIDDRRRALAEIEEWKNRYEAAILASGQILYDWDPATNAVTVAGATDRLLGCGAKELDSLHKWESRIHPDDVAGFRAEIERVIQTQEAFHLEYRMRHADGTYLEMEDTGYFFSDADGRIKRMVGFLSDVTSRNEAQRRQQRLESELNHKQKMEAVGNLAAGVAHDFSNLLTAINGHVALAYRGLPAKHPALASLRMVEKAAKQGADMTRSMLTFAHKTPAAKETTNLYEAVSESLRLFRHLLPPSINVTMKPPEASPPWVLASQSQLQQVVMNLLINARDAMPDGGEIEVDVRTISPAAAASIPQLSTSLEPAVCSAAAATSADRMALFSFRDNGTGMEESTLNRLFEPFFTTKTRNGGTGLGLPIVYGIVADHQGSVAVASAKGKGTRFDILLPCCQAPSASLAAPDGDADTEIPIAAKRPRTIALLLDEDFVSEIVITAIESAGYAVISAQSLDELGEVLEDHRAEVGAVLIDADTLPESDESVASIIDQRVIGIPIIVLTSNSAQFFDEPSADKMKLIPKPFQMSRLVSAIDEAVGITPADKP